MNLKTSVAWNRRESRRLLFIPLAVALLGLLFFTLSANVQAQSQLNPQQTTGTLSTAYIKVTFPIRDALWEKGKTYTVRWESKGVMGNVKIRLLNNNGRAFDLAANVANSGSFNCLVPANFVDGAYRIQVMKIDGSVKGQSGVTITIGVPKTTYAKVTGQAEQGKTAAPGKAMAKTGKAAVGSSTTTSSTGGARSTDTTASAGTAASASSSRRGAATAGTMVKQNLQVTRVSAAELKSAKLIPGATAGSNANKMTSSKDLQGEIIVSSPKDGDVWKVGQDVSILWKNTNVTGDVGIILEPTLLPGEWATNRSYTIVNRTGNTGSYIFHVPQDWLLKPEGHFVLVTTKDGKTSGKSDVFTVYTQNVDLECKIIDAQIRSESDFYVFYTKKQSWFQFNVLMRNNGMQSPVTIQDVLVQIIKEPEEIVCSQEEWGFSGIYPGLWYKLSEPRKFDISSSSQYWVIPGGKTVDLSRGSYRVEVTLDPQNVLGENQQLRQDNKAVQRWVIK